MMPRTANAVFGNQAFRERSIPMRARRAQRKDFCTLSDKHDRFTAVMSREWLVFGELVNADAVAEIGALEAGIVSHGVKMGCRPEYVNK
jgi:hypothetical protein